MISGAQIRMARGAMRWSVQELSEASGVSTSTIKRMELHDGETGSTVANLRAVQAAFERNGVVFVFEGAETGAVRYLSR